MTERSYEFNWDIIGDLLEGRPNLGDKVNLVLYRVMQHTFRDVAVQKFGNDGYDQLLLKAGIIAGRFFYENFLKEYKAMPLDGFLGKLRTVLDEQGCSFLRIDNVDTSKGEFSASIATGIDGLGPNLAKTDDYQYDVGFLEGILTKYAERSVKPGVLNVDTVPEILPKVGDQFGLVPYRMFQYTVRDVAEQEVGTEACDQLFYDAGDIAGKFFFDGFMAEFKDMPLNGFVAELQRVLKELGVGVLRVEKANPDQGEFVLTVSEDLDCSGLPDLGLEVCNYDEGFIAGIFYKYTGVAFNVKEVDCWCSGDRTCRFSVNRA